MNLRKTGLDWFRANRGPTEEPIRISRLYPPAESWTGRPAWWFEFGPSVVAKSSGYIHLLCQHGEDPAEFHHLRVPKAVFSDSKIELAFRADRDVFSLFLSAEPDSLFRELRGRGKIAFAQYEVLAATV
jgi:hypothetical protein